MRKNAEARVKTCKDSEVASNGRAATAGLQSKLAEQQNQIEALTAGLEEVSAQLELSKRSPRTVRNDQ